MMKKIIPLLLVSGFVQAEILEWQGNVASSCSFTNNLVGTLSSSGSDLFSTGDATVDIQNNDPNVYQLTIDPPTLQQAPGGLTLVSATYTTSLSGGVNNGEVPTGDSSSGFTYGLVADGSDTLTVQINTATLSGPATAGSYQLAAVATCFSP